jgi:hypothetical protein
MKIKMTNSSDTFTIEKSDGTSIDILTTLTDKLSVSVSTSAISSSTSSSCSITGSGNSGKVQTIIYTNSTSDDLYVTVPTTYNTPDGAAIELLCPSGGYCEVSYLNISGTIYARGV